MKVLATSRPVTKDHSEEVYINKDGFWVKYISEAELFDTEQDFCMESIYGTTCYWLEV